MKLGSLERELSIEHVEERHILEEEVRGPGATLLKSPLAK